MTKSNKQTKKKSTTKANLKLLSLNLLPDEVEVSTIKNEAPKLNSYRIDISKNDTQIILISCPFCGAMLLEGDKKLGTPETTTTHYKHHEFVSAGVQLSGRTYSELETLKIALQEQGSLEPVVDKSDIVDE